MRPELTDTSPLRQEKGSHSYMDPWQRQGILLTKGKLPMRSMERVESVVSRGHVVRTPAVLPLPGLGSMRFLSSLLAKAPATVFDNDAMAVVLRVLWKTEIQKYFILDLIVYAVFFTLWILLVDAKSSQTDAAGASFTLGIAITVLILNTAFAVKELVQSDYGRRAEYIRSIWNIIDLLSIGCVSSYIVAGFWVDESRAGLEPLAVVTSLLLTMVSTMTLLKVLHVSCGCC
jgi:hypothetical protein